MIERKYIAEWQEFAPWNEFAQVEQDLIISRALCAIFQDDWLSTQLAFRGGTALHKLYLNPAPRYSEDIDLVQTVPGPVGPIMKRLKEVIDFFEEPRKTSIGGHGAKAHYRFTSTYEQEPRRLKIEINCREHFTVFGLQSVPLSVESNWYMQQCYPHIYAQ